MGCKLCCCCKRGNKEKKPLLTPQMKQKNMMKRAISLENPQYSLPNGPNTNSLQNSLLNGHSLPNGNNHNNGSLPMHHVIHINNNKNNNDHKLLPTIKFVDIIHHFTNNQYKMENISNCNLEIINIDNNDCHIFKQCLSIAYNHQYPLRISPSHIWLLILQNININIDIDINIESMDDIIKYDINDNIKNDFSISNDLDDIATKICCLSANEYFKIPKSASISNGHYSNSNGFDLIRLDGTKNDWISLKTKTTKLLSMAENEENEENDNNDNNDKCLDLIQFLDKFIDSYDKSNDDEYWSYDNWINVLFPSSDNNHHGLNVMNITKTKQVFSGFLGIIQNQQTMEIQTKIGWFVVNKNDD